MASAGDEEIEMDQLVVALQTRFTSLKNATGDEAINQALAIIQQARDNITPEEGETARAAVEYLVGDAALEHVLIPTLEHIVELAQMNSELRKMTKVFLTMIHEHDEALAVQSYAATIASLLAKCKKPKKRKAEHDTTPPEAAEKAAQEEEEEQSQRKKSKKKRLPSEEVEDEHGPVKKKPTSKLAALTSKPASKKAPSENAQAASKGSAKASPVQSGSSLKSPSRNPSAVVASGDMLRVRHQDEGDYLDVEWTPRTKNSERLTTADAWSFCHLAVARRFAPAFRVDEKNNAKEDGYRLLVATEMGEGKCSLEVGGKKETALAYIAEHLADQILLRHPSLRQTFNKEFPRKKLVDAKFELETQIDFKQGCVHVIKALVEGSGDSASLGFGPWLPTEGELIGDGIGIQLRKVLDNMSRHIGNFKRDMAMAIETVERMSRWQKQLDPSEEAALVIDKWLLETRAKRDRLIADQPHLLPPEQVIGPPRTELFDALVPLRAPSPAEEDMMPVDEILDSPKPTPEPLPVPVVSAPWKPQVQPWPLCVPFRPSPAGRDLTGKALIHRLVDQHAVISGELVQRIPPQPLPIAEKWLSYISRNSQLDTERAAFRLVLERPETDTVPIWPVDLCYIEAGSDVRRRKRIFIPQEGLYPYERFPMHRRFEIDITADVLACDLGSTSLQLTVKQGFSEALTFPRGMTLSVDLVAL